MSRAGFLALIFSLFSHLAIADVDYRALGKSGDPAAVLEALRSAPNNDEKAPELLAIRFFHQNPKTTAAFLGEALDLYRTKVSLRSYLSQVEACFFESKDFRPFLQQRLLQEARLHLEKQFEVSEGDRLLFLSSMGYFLTSMANRNFIQTLEQILKQTPTHRHKTFYDRIMASPLAEQEGIDSLIELFRRDYGTLHTFLDDYSWLESMELLYNRLNRGYPPETEAFADSMSKVLMQNNTQRQALALKYIIDLGRYLGTQWAQVRQVQQLLSDEVLREALNKLYDKSGEDSPLHRALHTALTYTDFSHDHGEVIQQKEKEEAERQTAKLLETLASLCEEKSKP